MLTKYQEKKFKYYVQIIEDLNKEYNTDFIINDLEGMSIISKDLIKIRVSFLKWINKITS